MELMEEHGFGHEAGFEARLIWAWIFNGYGTLQEPAADYAGMLEKMEAEELMALLVQVKERLQAKGLADSAAENHIAGGGSTRPEVADSVNDGSSDTNGTVSDTSPERLYIDKQYNIRLGSLGGVELPLRPLVKAIFILFLKHPEGIILKDRTRFEPELDSIYETIQPNLEPEIRRKRVQRLMNVADNSFSEKTSALNATLDSLLPESVAYGYKVQGYNGHPRRIPLDPLLVVWE